MQLERNAQTRAQLWNRKAQNATWEMILYFPVASSKEPVVTTEVRYRLTYEAMIDVRDAIGCGFEGHIPDWGKLTEADVQLKHARIDIPYKRGNYSFDFSMHIDKRKAVVKLLGLQTKVLPTAITLERLV